MLFLVHSDFDVDMIGSNALRTRADTLQPFVPVVLFLRITVVILAVSAWRSVDTIGTMTMAATKERTGLAFAFQQIRQCASCGGLNKQHATESGPGFAREKAEDGFRASAIVCGGAVRALALSDRLLLLWCAIGIP